MKNQAYRMAMLYDFYGDLLTPRQKEFYDLYYNDDLSLAEIAENYDITRQGVRDIIVRAEKTLEDIEEKTGLIQRYHRTRATTAALRSLCCGGRRGHGAQGQQQRAGHQKWAQKKPHDAAKGNCQTRNALVAKFGGGLSDTAI